jgi:hypothetical protein
MIPLTGGAAEEGAMMRKQNAPEKLFISYDLRTTFLPITLCASLMRYLILTRRERFSPGIIAL